MKCIKERFVKTYEIKRSDFICVMIPLKDEKLVAEELINLRKEYPKATHYCYAYRINGKEKSNDDGEPSGTAGRPILEFLKKNELVNILCVVIRYFGGIKLGASGLLRAYIDACKETYDIASVFSIQYLEKYKATFEYKYYESIYRYLNVKNAKIIESSFEEKNCLVFAIDNLDKNDLFNYTNGNIEIEYLSEIETLVEEKRRD